MKKVLVLFSIIVLTVLYTVDVKAMQPVNNNHSGRHRTVKAPLDGGLLTVLGVAGVAYYAARKKNKKDL